jgi:hypothetical protein
MNVGPTNPQGRLFGAALFFYFSVAADRKVTRPRGETRNLFVCHLILTLIFVIRIKIHGLPLMTSIHFSHKCTKV